MMNNQNIRGRNRLDTISYGAGEGDSRCTTKNKGSLVGKKRNIKRTHFNNYTLIAKISSLAEKKYTVSRGGYLVQIDRLSQQIILTLL